MGEEVKANPLVSKSASQVSLSIQLHPLVLLTISDYITRHTLRGQKGSIIGAVIGQQNGRSYILEHAYECLTAESNDETTRLNETFFSERLEQYKDVHKIPPLELVAVFMLGPASGPQESHIPALKQVQTLVGSDNILLVLFHPETVESLEGGKLPISIYETVEEQSNDEVQMRFRERSFEVETGEAEMIGVDFVAKGGGNASAIAAATDVGDGKSKDAKQKVKHKGKDKDKDKEEVESSTINILSAEDDELVASLTAKANAIKMLKQRLELIRSYLATIPESRLIDASIQIPPSPETHFALLRNVQALLSRLPLLTPQSGSASSVINEKSTLSQASFREQEDVHLTSLLAALTRSVTDAQGLGTRYHDFARERAGKERSAGGGAKQSSLIDVMDQGSLMQEL